MMTVAGQRPEMLSLANWRQPPFSEWSFHHIRELLATENIPRGKTSTSLVLNENSPVDSVEFEGVDQAPWTLSQLCDASNGNSLLISHRGKLIHEWYAHEDIACHPHILFSVSKSIIATLVGIFVDNHQLDVTEKVAVYLPEVKQSGFAECTIQQLLDMTTSLDFEDFVPNVSNKVKAYWSSTGWSPAHQYQSNPDMHEFLLSLEAGQNTHGDRFEYQSPNTDVLGWVLESISGRSVACLLSDHIWRPLQAQADAYITVDRKSAARSAGGICALPRDLLRFGGMILNRGLVGDKQVIPRSWVQDCLTGGNKTPWKNGDSSELFPEGGYRNCWYQTGNENAAVAAIGLHGQWLYIDPVAEVVVVKNSAQSNPLNDLYGPLHIAAFEAVCRHLMGPTP